MSQLTLNLGQGSISFSFSPESAQSLKKDIGLLMENLKTIAQSPTGEKQRQQPKPPMEHRHTGDVFLEVFCNPNIYPSPFAAKVLLTVRDDRIRITSEAELTQLIEDLNEYLEQAS